MNRFLLLATGAALVANVSLGHASNSEDPPISIHAKSMRILIHKGKGPIQIAATGLTPVDEPGTFNCRNPDGCVITIQAVVDFGRAIAVICGYVDSEAAHPSCGHPEVGFLGTNGVILQSKRVAPGTHTVQIEATPEDGEFSGYVGPWEVNYTLYDR